MRIRIISVPSDNSAGWKHAFGGPIGNVFAGTGNEPNYINGFMWNNPNLLTSDIPIPLAIDQNTVDVEPVVNNTTASKSSAPAIAPLKVAPVVKKREPLGNLQSITNAPTDIAKVQNNKPDRLAGVNYDKNGHIVPNTTYTPEYQQKPWITTMRAIPVVGSSLQAISDALGWTNEEDYENPTLIRKAADRIRNVITSPIGRYMTYNPYDVDYEMNRIQNVGLGTQRGLLDTAGGNALAARNAMVALNNNITSQMGDARRSASQVNEQRRQAVQQFNSGIDQFNAQQALNAGIYNQRADEARLDAAVREAMLRDNIQSTLSGARSTNYTAALNNAGQFGNDRMFADMASWYQKYVAPFNKATQAYGAVNAAKGGKVKKVKGFNIK